MKIQPTQITAFLNKVPSNIRVIVFYGPDAGLIIQRSQMVIKYFLGNNFDVSALVYIYENELKDFPQKLEEELTTFSLFAEEKKVIVLRDTKDFGLKLLNNVIDSTNDSVLVVIESEDLSTSSSLRKTAEANQNWASIPCYQDSNFSLKDLIKKKITLNNFKIDDNAMNFLIENLGNNRLISEGEIDKLILYKYYEKHISLLDVLDNVDNQSIVAFDKFVYAFFDNNLEETYINLIKLLAEESAIAIIRVLLNHTTKLHYAKLQIEEGTQTEIVIKNMKPPIFFLYVDKFKLHLNSWKNEDLKNIIAKLIDIEILCKTNPILGDLSLKNFILHKKLV